MDQTADGNVEEGDHGLPSRAPLPGSPDAATLPPDDGELHLPAFNHRGGRIAELVARAAGTSAALVDLGGVEGPVVFAQSDGLADDIAAAWRAPADAGCLILETAGRRFAHAWAWPLALSGREGWVATVTPGEAAPPPAPAGLMDLIGELTDGWRAERDATELWVARLRGENALSAETVALARLGTLTCEVATGAVHASARASEILRCEAATGIDDLLALVAPHDRIALHRLLTGRDGFGRLSLDCEIQPPHGRPMFIRLRLQHHLEHGEPKSWIASVEDITDERRQLDEMRCLAERDPLTGLHNRNRLVRALAREVTGAREAREMVAMLMITLTDLKEINEAHGYRTGDLLLKYVGVTLRQQVRATDEVMRIGSGEFAVLLTRAASETGVLSRVQAIRAALASSIAVGIHRIDVRATIGYAIYPDDTVGGIDLMSAVTYALGDALAAAPRSVSRYSPAIRERREGDRRLIEEITRALRRREFTTFFQPQVDLETGAIVGFEALCRWCHPERGVLTPGAFYQALSSPVVSAELSDTSLIGSFKAARLWRENGLEFGNIAINMSATQLARPNLLEIIEELMRRFGVSPQEISFEVLENVLIDDNDITHNNLRALSHEGFTIALDDFGTGFASLTHIREPYISQIKIDRSFVTHAGSNARDQQIVAAIVQMARKLGLAMVAEGIEDEETLRKLRAVGCTTGQGFVFAPALPFEEATEFIGRQSRIFEMLRTAP